MSAKIAFVSTLGLVMLLNGFAIGAAPNSVAKDTKKKDDKSVSTMSVAANSYQPALMKPASWRHFQQQQHHHHRYTTNA